MHPFSWRLWRTGMLLLTKFKDHRSNFHYSEFPNPLQTKSSLNISIYQNQIKKKQSLAGDPVLIYYAVYLSFVLNNLFNVAYFWKLLSKNILTHSSSLYNCATELHYKLIVQLWDIHYVRYWIPDEHCKCSRGWIKFKGRFFKFY